MKSHEGAPRRWWMCSVLLPFLRDGAYGHVARARLNRPDGMRTCLQLPAYGYYQIPIHL